jgi:hypothetical protein
MENYQWKSGIDYEANPHLYEIGKGQQGVLICEPYKSRLHLIWRFKTPAEANASRQAIYKEFLAYLEKRDFVGADMCKKYLHMGFTRARRYANHKSGRKYADDGSILPQESDWATNQKAQSATLFYEYWVLARTHTDYLELKKSFIQEKTKYTPLNINNTNQITE